MVLAIGNGGGGQSTLPANQGDQRGASHRMMQGGGGGSNLSCQLAAAGATARATCDDVIVCWCDSLIVWLYDGVIVWWSDVKVIVVVVIGRGAATGDDDGDWDSNSANVGLAVIRQTIAFLARSFTVVVVPIRSIFAFVLSVKPVFCFSALTSRHFQNRRSSY